MVGRSLAERVLFALIFCCIARQATGQADISSELESIRASRKMPGMSAMAFKDGRVVAQGAAGVRKQGNPTPLLVTDPVNIGSCTKWITATVAGRLVDRGLIRWDTRVRDVFPSYLGFDAAFHSATLEQFLTHRSGVQDSQNFVANGYWSQMQRIDGTRSELRHWVCETVLIDPPQVGPGTYLYANQGYTVAARMMELITGKEWETLVQEEIFRPLRLQGGTFGRVYDGSIPPRTPVGHDLGVGQTTPIPRTITSDAQQMRNEAAYGPGGTVICTLADWAKFLQVQATTDINDFLSRDTAAKLQRSFIGEEGYGLGVNIYNRSWAAPGQALTHSGSTYGLNSIFWMAPARDFFLVAFANCYSADNTTSLALDDVARLLVGRYSGAAASGPIMEVPKALPLSFNSNNVAFEFLSLPGVRYSAEWSENLLEWFPATGASGQTATSLQTRFIDTKSGLRKFYRARALP